MKKTTPQFVIVLVAVMLGVQAGFLTRGATRSDDPKAQFRGRAGFEVEEVLSPEKSGSIVALTFDSRGRLAFSREKAGVFILSPDGQMELFTDRVTNCQGLCFDGRDLLAVGDGPDGTGLYRVSDDDGDGRGDRVTMLGLFSGGMGEHGPHAIFFGPDAWLYVVLGNHTGIVATPDPYSPLKNYGEEQILPIYGDPRGHAVNIRAPGGTVFRFDPRSSRWQTFAGGFRNMYDAAFNLAGELFTLDSDMEWDIDLPWYRPVRTNHIVAGGDYGWRTGSGVWPDYYIDSLPAMTNVGRGSPVGVEFYQHYVYPPEYFDSFLQGDWSRGRILVGFLKQAGATYSEKIEDFVLGEPLNITDLEVGPDGFVYFSKGGRITEGGLYRVRYTAPAAGAAAWKPEPKQKPSTQEALRQPQPRSAWGRARLAQIRAQMKGDWGKKLEDVVEDSSSNAEQRARALELLQVYGPALDEKKLVELGHDASAVVRAASTYYLGLHRTDSSRRELARRLGDSDDFVRRRACEALVRTEIHPGMAAPFSPVGDVFPLLDSSDRWVRYAARQVLKQVNRNLWRSAALQVARYPAANEALLALAETARGTNDVSYLLKRELELIKAEPREEDLLGLLRVLHRTMVLDDGVDYSRHYDPIGKLLLARFPGRTPALGREIALTLGRLKTPGAIEAILAQLQRSDTSREQQIFYAYCLRNISDGWTARQRDSFVDWFAKTQQQRWKGGASFLGYIENIWNDFLKPLAPADRNAALERVPSLKPETVEPGKRPRPAFRRANDNQTLSQTEVAEYLLWDPMSYLGDIEAGAKAYEKAYCSNCHLFGAIGQEAGPNLTDVGKRFQRKDLVDAIVYPSKTVSDQWAGVEIVTRDGKSIAGTVAREDGSAVTILTPDGSRVVISKGDIQTRKVSETSLMPEGLLENLTLRETVDLLAFLEQRTKKLK